MRRQRLCLNLHKLWTTTSLWKTWRFGLRWTTSNIALTSWRPRSEKQSRLKCGQSARLALKLPGLADGYVFFFVLACNGRGDKRRRMCCTAGMVHRSGLTNILHSVLCLFLSLLSSLQGEDEWEEVEEEVEEEVLDEDGNPQIVVRTVVVRKLKPKRPAALTDDNLSAVRRVFCLYQMWLSAPQTRCTPVETVLIPALIPVIVLYALVVCHDSWAAASTAIVMKCQ